MSYEEDVMYQANVIKDLAINRTVKRKEGAPGDGGYAAAGGPESYYGRVLDLWRPYSLLPDPQPHRDMANDLAVGLDKLSTQYGKVEGLYLAPANPDLTLLNASTPLLATWTGQAALDFNRYFIEPFPFITGNQYLVGSVLHGAISAQATMWDTARKNTLELQAATITALSEGEPSFCCGSSKNTKVLLYIIEAIATVSAVFTEGASMIALASVGAIAGFVGNASPDEKGEEVNVAGEYTWDIVAAMAAGIATMDGQIGRAEAKVLATMNATQSVVDATPRAFVANRPALAGVPANLITTEQYMGRDRHAL